MYSNISQLRQQTQFWKHQVVIRYCRSVKPLAGAIVTAETGHSTKWSCLNLLRLLTALSTVMMPSSIVSLCRILEVELLQAVLGICAHVEARHNLERQALAGA